MKKTLLLILFSSILKTFSQKVLVEGTAFDTTKGRNRVTVILNDTVKKFFSDTLQKSVNYSKLWNDTNYIVRTDSNGQFKIKAKKSDSLFFQSYRHIRKSYLVADLLKMDKINIKLEPQICETYVKCNDTAPKHYVFIGEKIKVDNAKEKYYCNIISMDSKFDVTYKIVDNIYGNYTSDTINFVAYDHNGRPAFENYEYVILFVSKYCDEFIHQKYQYYDVYKTTDNMWASPYHIFDYANLDNSSNLKPVKIMFKKPVEYDISTSSKEWVDKYYPSPYYKIENGKAIAVYGNYVPELLELKKQTVFKDKKIELK